MTIEADIFAALSGLAAGGVYPDLAPLDTPRPYITYQQVGGEAVAFLERALPSKKNGRYQVNVWADTRTSAAALALQVEAAFVTASSFQGSAVGAPVATYEPDTKLYGSMQDFTVWSDR